MANVHKDFHGALSYGVQFLEREYGPEGLREFLDVVGDRVTPALGRCSACYDLRMDASAAKASAPIFLA